MGNFLKILATLILACALAAAAPQDSEPGPAPPEPGEMPAGVHRTLVADRHASLDRHFNEPMRGYRSRHFVILHDAEPDQVRIRAELLEEVHARFRESFEPLGIELDPLEDRLVALLFDSEQPFLDYAADADARDMSWAAGYYSTRTNRVALIQPEKPLPALGEPEHDDATHPRDALEQLASTTHEAAHQLAFNKGLQRRGVAYPFWFAEGLAICFEMHEPDAPFGPGKPNPPRQRDLLRAHEQDRLIPLARFITMTRPRSHEPEQLAIHYAQAWSLFDHLYQHHPEQLADYIQQMHQQGPGPRSPKALRRIFEQAFGEIEPIEDAWLDALNEARDR